MGWESHKRGLTLGTGPFSQCGPVLVTVYPLVSLGDPGLFHCMSRFGRCLPRGQLLSSGNEAGEALEGPGIAQTMYIIADSCR